MKVSGAHRSCLFCLIKTLAYNPQVDCRTLCQASVALALHISDVLMNSQASERADRSKSASANSASVMDKPETSTKPSTAKDTQFEEDRDTLIGIFRQMLLIRR